MSDTLIHRLTRMLDGCLDTLDAAARVEAKRETGKNMRQITAQLRAERARALVAEATAFLDPQEDDQ